MAKPFKITNHNHYGPIDVDPYDEYSFVYTSSSWIGINPGRNLYRHKQFVLEELRSEISEDIDEYITICPASEINNGRVSFGLFVMEPERSALIKLTYS